MNSFILFDKFEDMQKKDQLDLLRTYSRKLEEENKSKKTQIKLLRQQLEKGDNSQMTSATSINSNITSCLSCKEKDNVISNLNKNIAELKQKYEAELQKIISINVKPQTLLNDHNSMEVNVQLQDLTKPYNQIKLNVDEPEKTVWETIKVDGSELVQNPSQIQKLREDFSLLRDKVQALEQKLTQPQNSMRCNTYESQSMNPMPLQITYGSNLQHGYRASPFFQSTANFPFQSSQCQSHSYISEFPLYFNSNYPINSPILRSQSANYQKVNYKCSNLYQASPVSGKINHQYSQPNYSNNLIEMQQKSLTYKIRVLQEANERLKYSIYLHKQ